MIYKKLFIMIIILSLLIPSLVSAESPDLEITANAAILIEPLTAEVIYAKNEHQQYPPASMTKMMTMLLVMEALAAGKADLEDKIVISERAASMGGSQVYLEPGEEMTLADLMKSIAISSANDSTVAVAEYLYGSETAFVEKMNERAEEIGMKNTVYCNTNGLPGQSEEEENLTTAYDLALLARELLKHETILEWTSTWIDYLRDGEFVLNNTNWLIRHYRGADGFKTGYTDAAKHCVTATAKRDGIRFIAVIMGADQSEKRFRQAARLLNYGFNSYEKLELANKDEIIRSYQVWNGTTTDVGLIAAEDLILPVRKGGEKKLTKQMFLPEELHAPLKKGQKVGDLKILKDKKVLLATDIIVDRDIEKASYRLIFKRLANRYFKVLLNIL